MANKSATSLINGTNPLNSNNTAKNASAKKDVVLYVKDDDEDEPQQGKMQKGAHHQMSPWMLKH